MAAKTKNRKEKVCFVPTQMTKKIFNAFLFQYSVCIIFVFYVQRNVKLKFSIL